MVAVRAHRAEETRWPGGPATEPPQGAGESGEQRERHESLPSRVRGRENGSDHFADFLADFLADFFVAFAAFLVFLAPTDPDRWMIPMSPPR